MKRGSSDYGAGAKSPAGCKSEAVVYGSGEASGIPGSGSSADKGVDVYPAHLLMVSPPLMTCHCMTWLSGSGDVVANPPSRRAAGTAEPAQVSAGTAENSSLISYQRHGHR